MTGILFQSYRPKRVITITEYASGREDIDRLFTETAERLAGFLNTKLVRLSLEHIWNRTKPITTDKGFLSHYAKVRSSLENRDICSSV